MKAFYYQFFIAIFSITLTSCEKQEKQEVDCVEKDWYLDWDGDGFGNPALIKSSCSQPHAFSANNYDCDDHNIYINPEMPEIRSDGLDNNCDGNYLLSIGDSHQGGIVFFLDNTGEHGLISALSDQGIGIPWCTDTISCYVANTMVEFGYGEQNTIIIVDALGDGNYAAQLCKNAVIDGFDDWYLPSLKELNSMIQILYKKGKGNFKRTTYWSSSCYVYSNDQMYQFARCLNFSEGVLETYSNCSNKYLVRAIRKF